ELNAFMNSFQFSPVVNKGNSGGPVTDAEGAVIGIVKHTRTTLFQSASGWKRDNSTPDTVAVNWQTMSDFLHRHYIMPTGIALGTTDPGQIEAGMRRFTVQVICK